MSGFPKNAMHPCISHFSMLGYAHIRSCSASSRVRPSYMGDQRTSLAFRECRRRWLTSFSFVSRKTKTEPKFGIHYSFNMSMKKYELMFILTPNFTEDEVAGEAKKVLDQLTKLGATITHVVDLGKKKLAYPIKKQRHGYYQLVEFTAEGPVLSAIDNTLRLDQTILRHLVLDKPDKSPEQIEKEQALRAKLAAKRQQGDSDGKPNRSQDKPEEALTAEELDKKLSKILEDTPSA